jgi:environmental stress-induced protein Ves
MPWKNGRGVTREYFRESADEPDVGANIDWRLSVAEVETDGPFSAFPGLRRILVLLSGGGMQLAGPEHRVVLREPLEGFAFAGDAAIDATLIEGATTDLNLMWRPDRWSVEWSVCRGALGASADDEIQVVFVAHGSLRLGDVELAAGDAAIRSSGEPGITTGAVVVFTLRRAVH